MSTSERPDSNWVSHYSEKQVSSFLSTFTFIDPVLFVGDRKYDDDPKFRKFKRQLYHSSISAILSTLKPSMSTPAIYHCPNGHFCHIIFGIGPFIADYPEQVMLVGIKQGWCPR